MKVNSHGKKNIKVFHLNIERENKMAHRILIEELSTITSETKTRRPRNKPRSWLNVLVVP